MGTPISAQRRPAPSPTSLPADVIALACAPMLVAAAPMQSLLITGGQSSFTHYSFAPGDLVTINGGTDNGIDVGQEYFVRRPQPIRTQTSGPQAISIQTAGWVRVYAVDKTMSLVTVSHACDSLNIGDYLEPFTAPQAVVAEADPPKPQRENYGRVLMGTDRRRAFAKDDFFAIDRGSAHGVTRGERVIIFRDKRRMEQADREDHVLPKGTVPEFLYELGEAVVVDVRPDTSTVRAIMARDALLEGDYVALRK
jgi:hypothetical protein